MALIFTTSYLEDARAIFRYYKKLADGAIAQVSDADLNRKLDPEMNSVAIVMKHLSGNMLSRWTDFLTSDGEKSTRNRDREFREPSLLPRRTARAMGGRVGLPLPRHRSADGRRPHALCDHSRRSPFRHSGH